MPRKLNVWGTHHYFDKKNRQRHAVVAAPSQKRAAELLRLSLYGLKTYASITSNAEDVRRAMEKPETVILTDRR